MNILDKLFKMPNPTPKIYKMLKQAIIPYRTTDGAAGYDMSLCMEADEEVDLIANVTRWDSGTNRSIIRSVIDIMNESGYYKEPDGVYLMPQSKVHLHTGIRMEIPDGYCGLLMNRSSLSNEDDLTICDNVGLIDSDYRGEVTLWMYNNSDEIKFIPNHKVQYSNALRAAVLSGLVFTILQYLYLETQLFVTRLNAVYGAVAAIPLFMFWMNFGWFIILFGAELSYAYQNVDNYNLED